MDGRAKAPGAGTICNALATGRGSAFAIDVSTTASVSLDRERDGVDGDITDAPDADTTLIERCVELTVARFGNDEGGEVWTKSDVPMAAGLKSSSAAANATVLATLDALDVASAEDPALEHTDEIDRVDACRLGVEAARDAGVTVTGAFDDASASMLGGVTVTDNSEDELLAREERDWAVLVWTPPERAFSADADVDRCQRIAPMADIVIEHALEGDFARAMTVNGFAFSAALEFPTEPMIEALPESAGVSLSGTGPSITAVGEREALETIQTAWGDRPGTTRLTTTQTEGATIHIREAADPTD